MEIIAGTARRIKLEAPDGLEVRPTAIRARKGLFDSLAVFAGCRAADLFAGSGALGLEAASRGAAEVLFVDNVMTHCRFIQSNIMKVQKVGVKTIFRVEKADVLSGKFMFAMQTPDYIFADPPYALSADYFARLCRDEKFIAWASVGRIIWELPDMIQPGEFAKPAAAGSWQRRTFGGTDFLLFDFAG